jgi:pyridoxal phosphate enzyme (YggS family)
VPIPENLRKLSEKVAQAAERSRRSPGDISIVAISKTFPVESVSEAIAAGQLVFGENRVQEAEAKIRFFAESHRIEWHLVGHLQSNKAQRAADLFQVIHSLDSLHLAAKLSEACRATGKQVSVLLQVDLGKEATKFGVDEGEVRDLVSAVSRMDGLRLDGLMIIPPYFEDPELVRPYFTRLRELKDALEREQPGCLGQRHLSMGMSHDFEVAVEEGATMIRIGTAIFGSRAHG